jgi:DNA-binding GntR family transcriptional regulator
MESLGSTPIHSQLWESVLQQLRLAIITGALPAGTHLVETELATRLAVSRGPVRDALTRLEHEGLIINYPYRGKFVANISEEDIHEVYELRCIIESRAIESLAHSLDSAGLDRLREIRQQMTQALGEGHIEEFADLDIEFHRELVRRSGRERLLKMWNILASVSHAFIVLNAPHAPEAVNQIGEGHDRILAALVRHDIAHACEVLKTHLDEAEWALLGTKSRTSAGPAQA